LGDVGAKGLEKARIDLGAEKALGYLSDSISQEAGEESGRDR
jgi:hypothetical protein